MEKALKVYIVYLDGIDKCGKDAVNNYITLLGNYKYLNKSRGIMSMIVYSKKYNRQYKYDGESIKNSLNVLLDVDYDDWKIRCKTTNEPNINYYDDIKLFNDVYCMLQTSGYKVARFNTSMTTPYMIAKHILELLEKLNGEEQHE